MVDRVNELIKRDEQLLKFAKKDMDKLQKNFDRCNPECGKKLRWLSNNIEEIEGRLNNPECYENMAKGGF